MAGRNSEESTYRVAQDENLIATGGWEAGRERKIVIFFWTCLYTCSSGGPQRGETGNIGARLMVVVCLILCLREQMCHRALDCPFTPETRVNRWRDLMKQQYQRKEQEQVLLSPPHALLMAFRRIEKYSYLLALKTQLDGKDLQS